MTTKTEKLCIAATFVVAIGAIIATTVYKFNDCKKVGHSTLYCLMDVSK